MKRRKDKKTFAKLGLLFTVLLILLASISMSYSAWTNTITIYGTINTGNWEEETAWARMYDDPGNFTYEFSGSNWATYIINQSNESRSTFYLYADQHHRVGELYVSNDSSYLYIEYDLDDGYTMSESHLHINTSLEGIPQNDGGPIPGQFDYKKEDHNHVNGYTYKIPWNQSWNNTDLYIAVHAVV